MQGVSVVMTRPNGPDLKAIKPSGIQYGGQMRTVVVSLTLSFRIRVTLARSQTRSANSMTPLSA